jgi:hypothetical protein
VAVIEETTFWLSPFGPAICLPQQKPAYSAAIWIGSRIASPEMFPEAEMLPHLICSRPMFIGGAKDEADQHGGTRRVGGSDSRTVCAGRPG